MPDGRPLMRDILFRAKTKTLSENYWAYIPIGDDWETIIDENTIGQFTGLRDRRGKRIFEGDIIRDGAIVTVVEWSNTNAAFWCSPGTVRGWTDCIIVGNIHDNPGMMGTTPETTTLKEEE
jgi:hypothetical protein